MGFNPVFKVLIDGIVCLIACCGAGGADGCGGGGGIVASVVPAAAVVLVVVNKLNSGHFTWIKNVPSCFYQSFPSRDFPENPYMAIGHHGLQHLLSLVSIDV